MQHGATQCRAFLARRRGGRRFQAREDADRRGGGLKMDWTKPSSLNPVRIWQDNCPMGIERNHRFLFWPNARFHDDIIAIVLTNPTTAAPYPRSGFSEMQHDVTWCNRKSKKTALGCRRCRVAFPPRTNRRIQCVTEGNRALTGGLRGRRRPGPAPLRRLLH